jgi:hypothetical protein
MITRENFQNKVRQLAIEVANYKGDLLLLGGKYLEGEMKQRIFNKGLNSAETPIGQYKSKWWKKKREKKGNQIGFVDLEFTSDLRNSIQVVQENDSEVVLAVINDKDFDKATGQEIIQAKKIGKKKMDIFLPSQNEEIETSVYITDLLNEKIEQIIARL